jgi:hypothetical protein
MVPQEVDDNPNIDSKYRSVNLQSLKPCLLSQSLSVPLKAFFAKWKFWMPGNLTSKNPSFTTQHNRNEHAPLIGSLSVKFVLRIV